MVVTSPEHDGNIGQGWDDGTMLNQLDQSIITGVAGS